MPYIVAQRAHRSRRTWGRVTLGVALVLAAVGGCGGDEGGASNPSPVPSASTGGHDNGHDGGDDGGDAHDGGGGDGHDGGHDSGVGNDGSVERDGGDGGSDHDSGDDGATPDAEPPLSTPIVAYTGSSAVLGLISAKGPFDMGHEFDVTGEGISVVDLGVWDAKADGLAAPHTVMLFSLDRTGAGAQATPIPGGSVVVPAGTSAPLEDGHRFAPLPEPLSLVPGHYAVVTFGLDENDPYGDGGNIPLSSTGITDATFDPQNLAKPGTQFPTGGDSKPHACASFRYRGPNTSFIKIMPLGASITEGWASSNTVAGYRGYLHTLLDQADVAHQFVGSSVSHPGPLPPDQRHHEGHPGYVIESLKADQKGVMDYLDAWLGPGGVTPDYILVLVGSNDVAGNNDFAHVGDRLDAFVTKISNQATGLAPKARLILSTIPRINDAAQEKRAVTFNEEIVAVATRHADAGENVATIDAHAVVTPADKADNLHPNDSGYAKIAPLWRDAILAP